MDLSYILSIKGSDHSLNLEGGDLECIFPPLLQKRRVSSCKRDQKVEEDKKKPVQCAADSSERTQWLKKDPLNVQFPRAVH